MILIERIKKLFQRKKKITKETRSISYIKNMMIISLVSMKLKNI